MSFFFCVECRMGMDCVLWCVQAWIMTLQEDDEERRNSAPQQQCPSGARCICVAGGVLANLKNMPALTQLLQQVYRFDVHGGWARCARCAQELTNTARVVIHVCPTPVQLPEDAAREVVTQHPHVSGCSSCLLCRSFFGPGTSPQHACSLGALSTVCVDALGVTGLADEYNALPAGHPRRRELEEDTAVMYRCRAVTASLVQLPGEAGFTTTLTYLDEGTALDSSHFKPRRRRQDAAKPSTSQTQHDFEYHPPQPGARARLTDAVRLLGARASLAPDAPCQPRFLYNGEVLNADRDHAEPGDGSLSAMDCVYIELEGLQAGARLEDAPRVVTVVELKRFGSAVYKLNHSCAARLHQEPVLVPSWQRRALIAIKGMPEDPHAPHDELTWDYDAICDRFEEEMVCTCMASCCKRLLVACKERKKSQVKVYDEHGTVITRPQWQAWLQQRVSEARERAAPSLQPSAPAPVGPGAGARAAVDQAEADAEQDDAGSGGHGVKRARDLQEELEAAWRADEEEWAALGAALAAFGGRLAAAMAALPPPPPP